jgi:hypothetical protein
MPSRTLHFIAFWCCLLLGSIFLFVQVRPEFGVQNSMVNLVIVLAFYALAGWSAWNWLRLARKQ